MTYEEAYADGIMAPNEFYDWVMKYAEKREKGKMKTAMYRESPKDTLVLAKSKDYAGLVGITLLTPTTGNLAGRAYKLPTVLLVHAVNKWIIAKDDLGVVCLIPRKKKEV